jgi:Periplasmic binding protein
MTPQMQDVAASGADVVQVVGNDAFCIAAFNGLNTAGYDREISSIIQCITDAAREGVPAEVLEGISITSTIALGATDDPTFQLYAAVMDEYRTTSARSTTPRPWAATWRWPRSSPRSTRSPERSPTRPSSTRSTRCPKPSCRAAEA